jgi:hypothetical protein
METGYFFIADILGFSRIVQNSTDEVLTARLKAWIDLVEEATSATGVARFQLLSDTLFAASESTEAGLRSIVRLARYLLENGIARSFPIRGAISHGTFQWGTLTFGKAVVTCHMLEQEQQWIGVACAHTLPHVDALWSRSGLVCYPAPLKSGPVVLHPVVAWTIPESLCLAAAVTSQGLVRTGEILTWDWSYRIGLTTQFRLYLKLLELADGSAERFHGLLPLEAIELNFPPKKA